MTPKQVLMEHIRTLHKGPVTMKWTRAQMRSWHAHQHHHYSPSHYHAGANLGPDQRPPGWYTGEDAVPKS